MKLNGESNLREIQEISAQKTTPETNVGHGGSTKEARERR